MSTESLHYCYEIQGFAFSCDSEGVMDLCCRTVRHRPPAQGRRVQPPKCPCVAVRGQPRHRRGRRVRDGAERGRGGGGAGLRVPDAVRQTLHLRRLQD